MLGIAAVALVLIAPASVETGTRIGMAKARAIALRRAPGRVAKAEYEREGDGWRYSFDIRQRGRIHEIGVDARTGRIVEDKFEAPGDRD